MEKSKENNLNMVSRIRCLAFRSEEDDGWCAVALECDVWGFGSSKEEAMSDLDELLDTHIEFAISKNVPHLLNHPTDNKWFKLWDELQALENDSLVKEPYAQSNHSIPEPLNANESYFHQAA